MWREARSMCPRCLSSSPRWPRRGRRLLARCAPRPSRPRPCGARVFASVGQNSWSLRSRATRSRTSCGLDGGPPPCLSLHPPLVRIQWLPRPCGTMDVPVRGGEEPSCGPRDCGGLRAPGGPAAVLVPRPLGRRCRPWGQLNSWTIIPASMSSTREVDFLVMGLLHLLAPEAERAAFLLWALGDLSTCWRHVMSGGSRLGCVRRTRRVCSARCVTGTYARTFKHSSGPSPTWHLWMRSCVLGGWSLCFRCPARWQRTPTRTPSRTVKKRILRWS
mmetsp:Transcript_59303/g.183843  ORF Transcript_59303/g.183843 Transcript_59303/m.183843 type:complete len:274 (-) Transcript_59303:378-1199(-)